MFSNVEQGGWTLQTRRNLATLAHDTAAILLTLAGLLGVSQPTSASDGKFVNLSTRALVETGEEVMIGGFVIEDESREVLIQAVGPELANAGISNALADPVLAVTRTDTGEELMANDNWEDSQGQLISDLWGGNPNLAAGSLSSAVVLTLDPGNYTAKVEGKDGSAGVALVEVYGIVNLVGFDFPGTDGRLVNLSTRALVGTGEEVMIGGFIIEDGLRQVLVQAKGPELVNDGISNVLADPVLTVTNTTDPANPRQRAFNDNWEDSQGQLVSDLWGGSPPLTPGSQSAAAFLVLEPGNYSAKVEGKDGTTGVALVEVYGIDSDSPGAAGPDWVTLTAFYDATDGANWARFDNWGTTAPLDQWYGVTVDENGRVIELDLSSNRLRGTMPPVLSNLSNLQYLDLSENQLSGFLPAELGHLSNLEYFFYFKTDLCVPDDPQLGAWLADIPHHEGTMAACPPDLVALTALYNATDGVNWRNRDNWLTGEPLANWYGLEVNDQDRVVRVQLTDNNLVGTLPPELGEFAHLESLLLEDNLELTGPIPSELGNLAQLREFALSWALVTGEIPPELGNLSSLRTLRLNGTLLTGSIPSELGKLSNLQTLELGFNGLTGGIPAELGNLSNLQTLELAFNGLTGAIPVELGNLTNLKRLWLDRNQLTGPILPELVNLSMLEILRLSQNGLTGSIPPELGSLSNLEVLSLSKNQLAGSVPSELGQLSRLKELNLAHNTDLAGVLPASLTDLGGLDAFVAAGTGLCAPSDDKFTDWLAGLTRLRITICEKEPAVAYLTQAVQSRTFPVPLVAGEAALLRVFLTAPDGSDAKIPPVRASFYLGGAEVHVAEIPGQSTAIPAEIDESSLAKSANAEIPAEVVQPGLEMVIDIDPESTLDPGLDIAKRVPEQGRAKLDVREMPPFELTVIPFLWSKEPDSSVLDIGGADDDLFWPTHTLLPIEEFRVDKHEPVTTSINDSDGLLEETMAIRVMEGGTGYYLGIMSGDTLDGPRGLALLTLPLAFAEADPIIVAHELGHTLGLLHAPCGDVLLGDTGYPQPDGSIGAFGYDFRDGGKLVPPETPDLMSYCPPPWIGDYHFGNALAFRLLKEKEATAAFDMETLTILLWGGVDDAGVPFLEPAFVVEAPPFLPPFGRQYEITGRSDGGGTLFSLSFDMPEVADGDGRSSFAFALPAEPEWAAALASITLKGPGGLVVLDQESDRPMKILRNPQTGQVRGILRDSPLEAAVPVDGAEQQEAGFEVLFSRGIPDAEAWPDRSR